MMHDASLGVARWGGVEAAFARLGLGGQVEGRNHHRTLRRELEWVAALWARLDEPLDPELGGAASPRARRRRA